MIILMNEEAALVYIMHCIFVNNHVRSHLDNEPHLQAVGEGHGGGLYLWIKESHSNVIIYDTSFIDNAAPFGGGASILIDENVRNVHVTIQDCIISHNTAVDSFMSNGGGIQLRF